MAIQTLHSRASALITTAVMCIIAGLIYYIRFRWHYGADINSAEMANAILPPRDWTDGTFPGFVHMLSLSLLSFGFLGLRHGFRLSLVLLAMTVIAEFTMGTTDPGDLHAVLLGMVVSCLLAYGLACVPTREQQSGRLALPTSGISRQYPITVRSGLVLCCAFFIAGSYTDLRCDDCSTDRRTKAQPVYMDYTTLRRSVTMEPAREIRQIKRIYLYSNYLFLNQHNEGIHVLDNTDPGNPQNIAFIKIPGNTEIEIRNNYLYADSYVDLVTLNLNDPSNISETNREIDIFPWDEYQNVPDDIYFEYPTIDRNRGVVVSYETR